MGGGDGAVYDAAMRLVEVSANPKQRKTKLAELRAASASAGKAMDELKQAKADLNRREETLTQNLKALGRGEVLVATGEKALSLNKVKFDTEMANTLQTQETERRRLAVQAKALDKRAEELATEAGFVKKEAAGAKAMRAKADKRLGIAEEMIEALRAIVCK